MNQKSPKKIISICGSYGKTTLKEILSQVLSVRFNVLETVGNENTPLGISKLVDKLTAKHDILLLEFGEFVVGDIAGLCKLFLPNIGIITGINTQHHERMGGIENAIKCMFEMALFCEILILNIDDQNVADNWQNLVKKDQQVWFYSSQNDSQSSLWFQKAEFDKENLSWKVIIPKENLQNIQNPEKSEILENLENTNLTQNSVSNLEKNTEKNTENSQNENMENQGNSGQNFSQKSSLNTNSNSLENQGKTATIISSQKNMPNLRPKLTDLILPKTQQTRKNKNLETLENFENIENSKILETFEINILGEYAVGNLICAVIIGKNLGMTDLEIRKGLRNVSPIKHRLEPIWNENSGVLVIDDSYSGNIDGVLEAIEVLDRLK